jgi:ribosome maturation factor RimP
MPAPSRQVLMDQIRVVVDRVCESEGLEVVETDLLGGGAHRTLRIHIDKPAGVTHEDCENVSNQVGTILDVEDVIPGGRYTLEVSSPGVERPLKTAAHWERFIGQKVKVVFKEPIEKNKVWVGELVSFTNGAATMKLDQVKKAEAGKEIHFTLDQVDKANLKFEW